MIRPFHPALCAKMLSAKAQEAGLCLHDIDVGMHTGTEDLPDAYRSIPVRPDDLRHNVVAVNGASHWSSGVPVRPLHVFRSLFRRNRL